MQMSTDLPKGMPCIVCALKGELYFYYTYSLTKRPSSFPTISYSYLYQHLIDMNYAASKTQ